MPRTVLIDTDAGVDDALALILALRSKELDVRAITTVAGNVRVRECTRNVLTILDHVGGNPGVLVAEGAARPLRRRLVTAREVHGADGLGNARPKARPAHRKDPRPAWEVMARLSRSFGKRLTMVALGPLTNVALALQRSPSSMRNIAKIVSMGGAFRVAGNTGPVAEFNYFVDPEAAQTVLSSGIPVTMIPLDLTQQIVVMWNDIDRRAARRANPLSRLVSRMTRFYMRYHQRTERFLGGYLHDPIAVAAAIQPSFFHTVRLEVEVETRGRVTRGMTVADFRKRPGGHTVQVALQFDKERFLKLFHEGLWK